MAEATPIEGEFDHIVVGAGSAGCVLANRLSADPGKRVLVLEAGGRDNWIWFHIPVGYLFAIGNPRADWMFKTEPEPGLNGRALNYPRGKVVGGSSAINGMIYMLGQSADYDNWRQIGLPGWSWDDVRPFFRKHVDHFIAGEEHGQGGEWRVEEQRLSWEILEAFRKAAIEYGIPAVPDFNTGDNEGICYFHVNQRRGRRWSAARGFLKPVLARQNLKLETGCLVEAIEFTGRRATAVRWRQDGEVRRAKCRGEVVLAAGAIGSPQILMLSGVGPAAHLGELGIPVVRDMMGVGQNLHDHLQLRTIYKVSNVKTLNSMYATLGGKLSMSLDYLLRRRGPMTMAPSQLGAFTRSDRTQDRANIQYHVQPMSLEKIGAPQHAFPAFTASVTTVRPTSRGALSLKSADPAAAPAISPNYLATPEDRQVAADSIRGTRRIVSQPALAKYRPEEHLPGRGAGDDEAALEHAAGNIGTTIFHPVGTARMGRDDDVRAVVDARLRVIGLEGLRVADASVMPSITSGNTNSPTMMIAEKCAAMIAEDNR